MKKQQELIWHEVIPTRDAVHTRVLLPVEGGSDANVSQVH